MLLLFIFVLDRPAATISLAVVPQLVVILLFPRPSFLVVLLIVIIRTRYLSMLLLFIFVLDRPAATISLAVVPQLVVIILFRVPSFLSYY